ncbi:MAG: hypothetical protein JSU06_02290 [Actinobacteria bacterium]|nr:hypothetical protein [Actinomycetota bacterium]
MTSQEARAARCDVREVGDGDKISGAVPRDFLLTCLRHDALHDVVVERLDDLAKDGHLDISRVAKLLPRLHEELLAAVRTPDWIYVAGAMIDAYRDATEEGGPR